MDKHIPIVKHFGGCFLSTKDLYDVYEKYNGKYIYMGKARITFDNVIKVRKRYHNGKKYVYVTYKYNGNTADYKYVMDIDDSIDLFFKEVA